MAAPGLLVQTILSALVGGPDSLPQTPQPQTQCGNDTTIQTGAASPPAIPSATPTNLPATIASLVSITALRDWLKLLVIGGIFEFCRRSVFQVYHTVYNWFFITAVFMEDDASYDWIMVWLSKQPSWTNARDVQISTRSFGLKSNAVLIPGEEDEDPSARVSGDRQLSYIPSYASSHSFWYKHRWCRVSRLQKEGTQWYKTKEEYLELCILAWDHQVLNDLLLEAKKAYKAAQENAISIYVSDLNHGWRHVTTRPKRPLSSIVLDPGLKDLLIEDARDFLESKSWYATRGIPFRRGYLLYGAPGSGKTSIIHSLAGELGLDIYIVSLSRSGLDDNGLNEIIAELPEKCIALMEDIDAAFTSALNRDTSSPPNKDDPGSGSPQQQQQQQERASKITLSGLLNALDGVSAQEGRLLFATTNKYDSLDPALTRPGRMDLHIEFKLASKYQALELYRCFYLPDSDPSEKVDPQTDKQEPTEKEQPLIEVDETASNISEQSTAVPSALPSPAQKILALPLDNSSDPTTTSKSFPIQSDGLRRRKEKAPKLSESEVNALAATFSDFLPEREFSMAALQGYLMMYKTRPVEAVHDFVRWIEKERREKKEREEKKEKEKEKAKEVEKSNDKKDDAKEVKEEAKATDTEAATTAVVA